MIITIENSQEVSLQIYISNDCKIDRISICTNSMIIGKDDFINTVGKYCKDMSLVFDLDQLQNTQAKYEEMRGALCGMTFYHTRPKKSNQAYLLEDNIKSDYNPVIGLWENNRNAMLSDHQEIGFLDKNGYQQKEIRDIKKRMASECINNSLYYNEKHIIVKKVSQGIFAIRLITWEI